MKTEKKKKGMKKKTALQNLGVGLGWVELGGGILFILKYFNK